MGLDVSNIAQLDDGAVVQSQAGEMDSAIRRVHSRAAGIKSTWAGLSAHYQAPEQGLVLQAMDTPETSSSSLSDKSGTAKTALDTYGARLIELAATRRSLVADIDSFYAEKAKLKSEINGFLGYREWTGAEDRDLLHQEEALSGRIGQFQADLDAAQRTCANAITAIWGGATYEAADRTTVGDETVFGLSADGYEQMTLSGEVAWGSPDAWRDSGWQTNAYMVGRGAVRSVTDLWDFGKALTGFGEDGEASAAWSGLWDMTKSVAVVTSPALMAVMAATGRNDEVAESGTKALGLLKGVIGYGTWKTSGWNTAGTLAPDIVAAVFTGGTAAAAKGGLKGALKGSLASLTRMAPAAATKIDDLASAMRASMRGRYAAGLTTLRRLNIDGLTAVRDAGYRVSDAATSASRTAGDVARSVGSDVSSTVRGVTDGLSPRPALAGVTDGVRSGRAVGPLDDLRTAMRTDGPSGADAGWPSARHAQTDSTPSGSSYAGDSGPGGSGMLGRPNPHTQTVRIDVGDDLMPRAREGFGQQGEVLEPNTRYEVRGRGFFHTDADGVVEFVEPMRKQVGVREFMSTDLRNPMPNVTYQVDDYAYFHTNADGLTDHVHVENLELRPDTKASRAANTNVTAGSTGMDAGHLLARGLGGTREEINLVQMVRDLNRGQGGRSLLTNDSVRHIELEIERSLRQGPPTNPLGLDVRVRYGESSRAESFRYTLTDGGGKTLLERRVRNR